jgi:hypothetical protein
MGPVAGFEQPVLRTRLKLKAIKNKNKTVVTMVFG